MKNRREFIKISALGSMAMISGTACSGTTETDESSAVIAGSGSKPIVVSTWKHGLEANAAAWKVLSKGGSALDASEAGVRVTESDPENLSVGLGGLPDREGIVTLDACIMDHKGNCGAVAFLQDIENPISVARKVMEETPHVMLAGEGAYQFAREQGFPKTNLLTEKARLLYEEWLKTSKYETIINRENHDTIGMLAIDSEGNLSGACTTSGMSYKLHGRVGDSPIIGAGLFVDNEVGAACATGVGEAVIRVAGSSVIVEMMRHGKSPQEACEEAVRRIIEKHENIEEMQVAFLALDKQGRVGSASVHCGFSYALKTEDKTELIQAKYKLLECTEIEEA